MLCWDCMWDFSNHTAKFKSVSWTNQLNLLGCSCDGLNYNAEYHPVTSWYLTRLVRLHSSLYLLMMESRTSSAELSWVACLAIHIVDDKAPMWAALNVCPCNHCKLMTESIAEKPDNIAHMFHGWTAGSVNYNGISESYLSNTETANHTLSSIHLFPSQLLATWREPQQGKAVIIYNTFSHVMQSFRKCEASQCHAVPDWRHL